MRSRAAFRRRPLRSAAIGVVIGALATCAFAHASVHVVTLDGMTFTPADITIHQGDAIRFEYVGGAGNLHNVHADNNRFICSVNCTTNNAPSEEPWRATVGFTQLGTVGYYCDQHGNTSSGMRGSITVIDRVFVDGFETNTPASP